MNAPFVTADHRAERDAFASLALTMRRNAHAYRAWACKADNRCKSPVLNPPIPSKETTE